MNARFLSIILFAAALLPGIPARAGARIINGHASLSDTPWVVSLSDESAPVTESFSCGGTLIGPDTVITAAHCVIGYDRRPSELRVIIGRKQLSDETQGIVTRAAVIAVHPDYDVETLRNDIALIRLAGYYPEVPAARLPADPAVLYTPQTSVSAYGWGYIDPFFPVQPDMLQTAEMPLQDASDCRSSMGVQFRPDSMVCAGVKNSGAGVYDGIDTCNGDSGGPLGVMTAEGFTLLGITSWGITCTSEKYWGVYTKVGSFLDWIRSSPQNAPFPYSRPRVEGAPVVGNTLRCKAGHWSDETVGTRFQWIDGRTGKIKGASQNRYVLTRRDIGRRIGCETTKENWYGQASTESRFIGPVLPRLKKVHLGGHRRIIRSAGRSCVDGKCYLVIRTFFTPNRIDAIAPSATRSTAWEPIPALDLGSGLWRFKLPRGFLGGVLYLRIVKTGSDEASVIRLRL